MVGPLFCVERQRRFLSTNHRTPDEPDKELRGVCGMAKEYFSVRETGTISSGLCLYCGLLWALCWQGVYTVVHDDRGVKNTTLLCKRFTGTS